MGLFLGLQPRVMKGQRRWSLAFYGAALVVAAAASCKPVEVIDPPDSSDLLPRCEKEPIAFCDAMAPDPANCTGDPASKSPVVQGLLTDASYPVGCVANLIAPIQGGGDCRVTATCRCVPFDAGSEAGPGPANAWSCFP